MKGQGARDTIPAGFEGGQLPLMQRIPKLKGFTNPFRVEYAPVNLHTLQTFEGDVATPETLANVGLVKKGALVKVLARGEIDRAHARRGPRLLRSRPAGDRAGRRDRRGPRTPVWGPQASRKGQRSDKPVTKRPVTFAAGYSGPGIRGGRRVSMLSNLKNIWKVPDLRNKVAFTILIIAIYELGANIITPYISPTAVAQLETQAKQAGILGFLSLFSGNGLLRMAMFGLGIMPYITSSIIIQLLSTVIPKLEEWRDQGALGQKKLTQTTRYLTLGLALLQSASLVYLFHHGASSLLGSATRKHQPDPELHLLESRLHRPHPHDGHLLRHVARRADHPARDRQRHVDPDLLQRGSRHPRRRRSGARPGRRTSSSGSSSP